MMYVCEYVYTYENGNNIYTYIFFPSLLQSLSHSLSHPYLRIIQCKHTTMFYTHSIDEKKGKREKERSITAFFRGEKKKRWEKFSLFMTFNLFFYSLRIIVMCLLQQYFMPEMFRNLLYFSLYKDESYVHTSTHTRGRIKITST